MADPPATGRDWLRGHRAALILTFDIDAESCMLAEGCRYAAHPNVMSHQAFGPLVGVPRILDMLGAQQVRATFFVPGVTAGRYPELIRRIDARGGNTLILKGFRRRDQASPGGHNHPVGAPEMLETAVPNWAHALGGHLVLQGNAGDAGEVLRALHFAVDQVVVALVGGGLPLVVPAAAVACATAV